MKSSLFKYAFSGGLALVIIACSTKRNSFVSRNSHALSTKYNILYNGGIALDAGVKDLTLATDNFWERLPIEPMQPPQDAMAPGQTRNANFERAETKAIKAIQKHSMLIGGSEKNPQMDEAHLMLGKARYYDQRYVPALEAFNYILYKYPGSDKIYEAKVWREKTNIRLENDQLAVNNLRKLLSEIKLKDQIFADANAILAQAFLNLEEKDSAVARLKVARDFTEQDEQKARYRFILGQLYEELGYKDSAYAAYQSVIDMNLKAPRQYVVQAHNRQASQFDFTKGDTVAFLKKYKKLLKDRYNRPYLGALNHQMGIFYDKQKNYRNAIKYYNASLNANAPDQYLMASNYRNLAEIYFNKAKYATAGQYYDSTLVQLNQRSREFKLIKKKRENLVDVIKFETIAQTNDSILRMVAMTDAERVTAYEQHITRIKKEDEIKKALADKAREAAEAAGKSPEGMDKDAASTRKQGPESGRGVSGGRKSPAGNAAVAGAVASSGTESDFYFYNPTTVAFGKAEFRKNWGDRTLKNNWRISSANPAGGAPTKAPDQDQAVTSKDTPENSGAADERYSVDYYIDQLPKDQKVIDSLAKERNFAYYQLGVIYKEKFREYARASDKLEALLANNPEERLILPAMYNLYKIYELTDPAKAQAMRGRIIDQYPDSRYAQILNNANSESIASLSPEIAYDNLYRKFREGDYRNALIDADAAVDQYTGDEIVSKFELLRAQITGKLKGLGEYRKALNFVALNYPNSPEGKQAEDLLGKEIPALENLKFSKSETTNWKILYRSVSPDDKATKNLRDKIKKFLADRELGKLTTSYDIYTMNENFVVIHGPQSEDYAKGIASILKEFKDYKVPDTPIIISGQNYEIVQMKKNLDEYLNNPQMIDVSVTNQLPYTPSVTQNTNAPSQPKAVRNPKQGISGKNEVPPAGAAPGVPQMNPAGAPGGTPGKSNPATQSQPPGLGNPPPSSQSPRK
ncbi:MAG: tetratricopeptide repeat protein [Flavobacterium sp.]|nr:MAG: tetratricopeptide repeat protein [Flavobacterium sp.]